MREEGREEGRGRGGERERGTNTVYESWEIVQWWERRGRRRREKKGEEHGGGRPKYSV